MLPLAQLFLGKEKHWSDLFLPLSGVQARCHPGRPNLTGVEPKSMASKLDYIPLLAPDFHYGRLWDECGYLRGQPLYQMVVRSRYSVSESRSWMIPSCRLENACLRFHGRWSLSFWGGTCPGATFPIAANSRRWSIWYELMTLRNEGCAFPLRQAKVYVCP